MPYRFEAAGYRRGGAARTSRGARSSRRSRSVAMVPDRFVSVDALRGFDMFWIVGAAYLVSALERWTGAGFLTGIKAQLHHVDWEGFAFYDLIFPLFVFITGVSAAFSLKRIVEREGRTAAAKRIIRRTLLLFFLGLIYSGGVAGNAYVPPDGGDPTTRQLIAHFLDNTRLLGVLNRIALAYGVSGFLYLLLPIPLLLPVFGGLLLGYWGIMANLPIRDISLSREALATLAQETGETNTATLYLSATNLVTGRYGPGYNVANHFDYRFLPGRKHDGNYDPEGILSTMPAVATCLLGMLAGAFLLSPDTAPTAKTIVLVVLGILLVATGFVWGLSFPVVKKIWTSSFVCVAGGYSLILLGVFHQIVDVWAFETWCRPFVWIGSNALVLYLGASILNYRRVAERLVGGPIAGHLGRTGEVLVAGVALFVLFWFARYLYRRQLFLRL